MAAFVLIVLICCASIAIAMSRSADATIKNSGRITLVGLDAYGGDIASGTGTFSVNLGDISFGGLKSVSFRLRSISNAPATLSFRVDSWQPAGIAPFMHVSWSYSGSQIAPNEEIPVRIDISTVASAEFVDYLANNHVASIGFSLSIQAFES